MPRYIGYEFTGTANTTVVTPSYYEKVELLLKGEGSDASTTFIDDSIRNRSVDSLVGAVQIDTAQFKFGSSSILFDGTDDFIRYGGSTGFEFTGVFTIDTWFRTGTSGTNLSIIGTSNESAWTSDGYYVFVNNGTFSLYRNGTLNDTFVAGATIADSTWHHWHMTRHANNAVEMGLDGTSLGFSTTAETGNFGNASFRLAIGSAEPTGTTQPEWNGHMDHFRITKGTTLFNGTYTVPTESDYNYIFDKKYNSGVWSIGGSGKYSVIGRRKQGNWLTSNRGLFLYSDVAIRLQLDGSNGSTTFTDESTNSHSITAYGGAVISTAQSKSGGASGRFPGAATDYAQVNTPSSVFAFGDNDYTIEFWIYTAETDSLATCVSHYDSESTDSWLVGVNWITANKIRYLHKNGVALESTTTINNSAWYHIAIVRASGTSKLYVNGTEEASSATSYTSTYSGNNNFKLGRQSDSGFAERPCDCYIDDLRIVNGAAIYTENFTPPTSALPTS